MTFHYYPVHKRKNVLPACAFLSVCLGLDPTSSIGSSFRRGRELDNKPTIKGVGVQTMSIMEGGSTGM